MKNLLVRLYRDENGSEVIEYAVMLGVLVLCCIGIMGMLGVKIVERWEEIYELL